jgi:transposase-like protein
MSNQSPASPKTFLEFAKMFPDEAAAEAWLAQWRWPDGVRCPRCDGEDIGRIATRSCWQCRDCAYQFSVRAGTALHRSKVKLHVWLYAIWLVAVRKVSISALQLQRETGLGSYETAWALLHKVRAILSESCDYPLSEGVIEVDESQVYGRGSGRGRKLGIGGTWLVAAVERVEVTNPKNGRRYKASRSARARVVRDTRAATLTQFVADTVDNGSAVITDGWGGYGLLAPLGYRHQQVPVRGAMHVLDSVQPKVHLFFSNFKTWLDGTFHGVSPKYLPLYLSEYLYRFNRRHLAHDLFGSLTRRLVKASHTPASAFAATAAEATG